MNTLIDMTGKRFGAWLVLHRSDSPINSAYWLCRCECGTVRSVWGSSLRKQKSRNCGCLRNTSKLKHGDTINGTATTEYLRWTAAKQRCYNKNDNRFKDYGGRGITMCGEWRTDFSKFLADMGRCPEGLTLERIDNDKGYSPDNCKWATYHEQRMNQRSSM